MSIIKKDEVYIGDIYESLTDGKISYEIFLNRFYLKEIISDGILVKKDAKLIKLKYEDAYLDIDKITIKNILYLNIYEEHKSVNDLLSEILKRPNLEYMYEVPKNKGDLFIANVKKYYLDDDNKKLSLKKLKKNNANV